MITQANIDRFFTHVEKTGRCWNWTACKTKDGYGRSQCNGRPMKAHRFSYMIVNGNIPEHMLIHHICRNTSCVNPSHLELVTKQENDQRRTQLITHCPAGHPYDEENIYWYRRKRSCKECMLISSLKYSKTEKGKAVRRKYRQTEKGKASSRKRCRRYRAKKKEIAA